MKEMLVRLRPTIVAVAISATLSVVFKLWSRHLSLAPPIAGGALVFGVGMGLLLARVTNGTKSLRVVIFPIALLAFGLGLPYVWPATGSNTSGP